ncbi:MAG: hypothetical protein IJD54_00450 [Clostridia bacterium]|nr:hypothetical protein [Clostridia bacterium]
MIEYYDREELFRAKKQRKAVLTAFFIVLAVYILASVGIVIWYSTLPYESPTITWTKVCHHSLSAIMVIFSFIFMGIKYRRVHKYYKIMTHLDTGLRETSTGSFFEYNESIQDKDGVDFKSLVFLEWNKYKNDFFERKVLVFNEREFPEFQENDNVRYVTQGNVLISYEILD